MGELSGAYEVRKMRKMKEKKIKTQLVERRRQGPRPRMVVSPDDEGVVLRRRGVALERGDALRAGPSSNAVVMRGHSRVTRGWCGATRGLVPATAGLHEVSVVAPRGDEIKRGTYRGAYCSGEALP